MAINSPSWAKPGSSRVFVEGSMRALINHGVSELLIVVGEFEHYERLRDVSFVTPSQRPLRVKHAMSEAEKKLPNAFQRTWPEMEEDMVESMKNLKIEREEERKVMVECK